MSEEKFFRPDRIRRGDHRTSGAFQTLLWKMVRIAGNLLLLLCLCFAGYQGYVYLLEDPFFQVKEVEVRGCKKIPERTIRSLAKIEGMPNLFTLSLKGIANRVASHPWVDHVTLRKIFPNRVLIQIEERKPIAILQLDEPYYIDSKGVIFSQVGDRDEYNFPILTGLNKQVLNQDSSQAEALLVKALEFLKLVQQEPLSPLEEISEIRMGKTFGIQCFTMAEGVEVKMGWDQFEEKLRRLSLIWSDLQKRGMVPHSIDCSDLKRMVVKRISHKSR